MKQTGWGAVAGEYGGAFTRDPDSYHASVILPNILRLAEPKPGKKILEVGCGDGYFTGAFAAAGAEAAGCDISAQMIAQAKKNHPDVPFFTAPADELTFAQPASFDTVVIVLALQNIENLSGAIHEAARVLKPGGECIAVLNHPAFRIPKRSSWGFDEERGVQYRRLDGYLSESAEEIDMDPGKAAGKRITYSFHRPLQVYFKALSKNNFGVVGLEEWVSHKKSEKGPRQKAEDISRKEFPLFLALKARAEV